MEAVNIELVPIPGRDSDQHLHVYQNRVLPSIKPTTHQPATEAAAQNGSHPYQSLDLGHNTYETNIVSAVADSNQEPPFSTPALPSTGTAQNEPHTYQSPDIPDPGSYTDVTNIVSTVEDSNQESPYYITPLPSTGTAQNELHTYQSPDLPDTGPHTDVTNIVSIVEDSNQESPYYLTPLLSTGTAQKEPHTYQSPDLPDPEPHTDVTYIESAVEDSNQESLYCSIPALPSTGTAQNEPHTYQSPDLPDPGPHTDETNILSAGKDSNKESPYYSTPALPSRSTADDPKRQTSTFGRRGILCTCCLVNVVFIAVIIALVVIFTSNKDMGSTSEEVKLASKTESIALSTLEVTERMALSTAEDMGSTSEEVKLASKTESIALSTLEVTERMALSTAEGKTERTALSTRKRTTERMALSTRKRTTERTALSTFTTTERTSERMAQSTEDFTQCGIGLGPAGGGPQPRIIGGKNAAEGAWPWMAGLYRQITEFSNSEYFCGGTLISPDWILTAAHCVHPDGHDGVTLRPQQIKVVLGSVEVYEGEGRLYHDQVLVNVGEIIIHSNFNSSIIPRFDYDIALLRINPEDRVELSRNVRTICLPDPATNNNDLYELGADRPFSYVTGWGITSYSDLHYSNSVRFLQQLAIPLKGRRTCEESIRALADQEMNNAYDVSEFSNRMRCAGYSVGDRTEIGETIAISDQLGECRGDSGGPLVRQMTADDGSVTYYQIGIISWGYECARPGQYGFYTDVKQFHEWINEKMA